MNDNTESQFLKLVTLFWDETRAGELDETLDVFYAMGDRKRADFLAWLGTLIYKAEDKKEINNFFNSL